MVYNTFYVRENDAGIPSLYRLTYDDLWGSEELLEEELITGVDSMQVLYGQRDNRGTADNQADDRIRFVSADDDDLDMTEVDVIRVGLLIRSNDDVVDTDTARTYNVLGQEITIASTDKKLRKIFKTTIKLRNRDV